MSEKVETKLKLPALLHDAEEAYWGDMIKPLKALMKINYPEILIKMKELRHMIFDKFNVPVMDTDQADWVELEWEFEHLVLDNDVSTFDCVKAEIEWLKTYRVLKLKYGC